MYHGVFKPGLPVAPYGISAGQLEQQLALLKKLRYQIVTFGQLLTIAGHQAPRPRRMAVLTFDDGDSTFTETALPLLRRFGMKATLFLIHQRLGQPGFMDASEAKQAIAEGIEVGVHSMTHPNLCQCSQEQLNQEIVESKVRLESTLGTSGLDTFCYPYGHHHPGLYPLLKRAGYRGAVAVFSRERTVTVNPYAMRRIHPHPGDSALRFRLKLSASYLKWVAYRDRNRQTTA
jgi:peptidoglycan/xylan/chitin deacetylase (PgdA/CDA1 family)